MRITVHDVRRAARVSCLYPKVPPSFWTRLANKYGTKFYWQENGEEASIRNAVSAIDTCFREDPGKLKCSKIQGDFGEEPSSGKFGKAFFGQ